MRITPKNRTMNAARNLLTSEHHLGTADGGPKSGAPRRKAIVDRIFRVTSPSSPVVDHDPTANADLRQLSRISARSNTGTGVRKIAFCVGGAVEVVETGPSIPAQLMTVMSRLTIKPVLTVGTRLPRRLPWPCGAVGAACQSVMSAPAARRATVTLPNASAQLIHASRVIPTDGSRRVVLYLHGGAFMARGTNSHTRVATVLSQSAESSVLLVNYRLIPKHSIGMALDDCHDGYRWLRERGYEPGQIVLAGDSAGGYLALALALRLKKQGEQPAALVAMSPLFQLKKGFRAAHPNIRTDAMFPPKVWDALPALLAGAAAGNGVAGDTEELYEPLQHICAGLPRTLIHVSSSEVLLHDAWLAADRLAAAGVPAELWIWPGQTHVFQLATPIVPEATRSLRHIGAFVRDATGGDVHTSEPVKAGNRRSRQRCTAAS